MHTDLHATTSTGTSAVTQPRDAAPAAVPLVVSNERLLRCGQIAGPLFVGVSAVHVATRSGFDLHRHPLSMLMIGEVGSIEIAAFIVSGLLVLAAAVGMRGVLHAGRAATWGPRLVAVHGAGLVIAGVFSPDPGDGFPAGTPLGNPDSYSWHFYFHNIASTAAFISIVAACVVFARRPELGRAWREISVAVAIVFVASFAWPDPDGISWRIAFATVVSFSWLAGITRHLRVADKP